VADPQTPNALCYRQVLRTLIFAYMLAITIYRPIDNSDDGEYLTYFTNINWILLNVYFGVRKTTTVRVYR
jgi:hypothetical protein